MTVAEALKNYNLDLTEAQILLSHAINKDKLLYVNPRLKKGHRASKYIKNYKANSTEKKKRKSIIYMRHLTDNINDNIYKNILGEQYNEKIHDISNKVTTKNEDEKEKVKKKTLLLDEKN